MKKPNPNHQNPFFRNTSKPRPANKTVVGSEAFKNDTSTQPASINNKTGGRKLSLSGLNKKFIIFIASLSIIFLASMTYLYVDYRSQSDTDCSKPTCQEILREAVFKIVANDAKELEKTVGQIKAIRGYEQQPNYMFVITQYDITSSNPGQARVDLEKLKLIYDDKVGYSEIIQDISSKPTELEEIIKSLEEVENKNKANFGGVKQE